MRTFAANYAGRCRSEDCAYGDHRISAGDDVAYVDDELMHAECAADAGGSAVQRVEPALCGGCWQYHAGECL